MLLAGEWGLLPVPPNKPRGKEDVNMRTKNLSLMAIYAALYAALVVFFQPLSFNALQIRVAGILRPGIARKKELVIAYAIGTVVANLFSPFTGIYEIAFMPVMSLVAGVFGYEISKRFKGSYYVCGIVIALVISLSVSWMLYQLFKLPVLATLPGLLISEQFVNFIGSGLFRLVDKRYEWWKL